MADSKNIIDPTAVVSEGCSIQNSTLKPHSRLKSHVELRDSILGDYSYISSHSVVNKTKIKKFSSIAHGTFIGLWEHNTYVTTHSFYLYETSGGFVKGYENYDRDSEWTSVGNDVWIGANAVVLKGVSIGDGAIVAAGSVVTKDVPPYAIVAGNPARLVRYRFDEEDIGFFNQVQWWDIDREIIQEMVDAGVWKDFARFKKYCVDHKLA